MDEKHGAQGANSRSEVAPVQEAAAVEQESQPPPSESSSERPPQAPHRRRWKRTLLIGVVAALGVAAAWIYGVPWVQLTLNTVSTDDAYVNGHVTFVAPRVRGQVARVLVDDNNRVHKGELLAQLDKEPFEDAVAEKRAAVDIAQADLLAATALTRGLEAEARSGRWKLQHAIEDVDNQVARLRAQVATLDKSKADLALAQAEFDRAAKLVANGTVTRELYDQRQAALSAAKSS